MTYKEKIAKEDIEVLPIAVFEGTIVIVDKEEHFDAAMDDLEQHGLVGIDTETKPSFSKGKINKVCLVQISTEDTCYLFRLNKIGFPERLRRYMEAEGVKKIGLSLLDDLRGLQKLGRFDPKRFVDLQEFVEDYGILDKSLKKISAIVLDSRISKKQRLTNWENSVLTVPQLRYAATDAWICLLIYNKLKNRN